MNNIETNEDREVEDILSQIRARNKNNKSPKVNGVTLEKSSLTLDEIRAKFTNSEDEELKEANDILAQIREMNTARRKKKELREELMENSLLQDSGEEDIEAGRRSIQKLRVALKGKDYDDWCVAEETGDKETASAVLNRIGGGTGGSGIVAPQHTHTFPGVGHTHSVVGIAGMGGYTAGEMVTISSDNGISLDPEIMRRIEKLEDENEYYKDQLQEVTIRFEEIQGQYSKLAKTLTAVMPPPVVVFDKNEFQDKESFRRQVEADEKVVIDGMCAKKREGTVTNQSLKEAMKYSTEHNNGYVTKQLGSQLEWVVHSMGKKAQFRTFRFLDEMEEYALSIILKKWSCYDGDNPFAYLVSLTKNAFQQVIDKKKKEHRGDSYDRAMKVIE